MRSGALGAAYAPECLEAKLDETYIHLGLTRPTAAPPGSTHTANDPVAIAEVQS